MIVSLKGDGRTNSESDELRLYITEYYKNLFWLERKPVVKLHRDFWLESGRLSLEQSADLVKPFSVVELEAALKMTNEYSTRDRWLFGAVFLRSFGIFCVLR